MQKYTTACETVNPKFYTGYIVLAVPQAVVGKSGRDLCEIVRPLLVDDRTRSHRAQHDRGVEGDGNESRTSNPRDRFTREPASPLYCQAFLSTGFPRRRVTTAVEQMER